MSTLLRSIRLDRVRAELQHRTPEDATVAAVARMWGCAYAGRFSAAYARRYGEMPSETLRR
ncbi:helix-turn-helix domain-containing protein [Curtobacterium sp. RHCKG23]|uniref:Helix-turn-helix domain-containing protein n=1 Tax=Curtobacterium citri TaxID=3055139 RepID=A0ABT7TB04_9MICO|nr:helix-turn-helix domain-containing protein [Curtobacterium citri]MDM7886534.1 helix-turn-helix domain-containing protein [Curtobacterium citri]